MTERSNLITINSFTPDKLKVESPKEKKSKGGQFYYNSQISYAGGKARILPSGVFQVSDYAKKNFGKKELSLILLPNEGEEIEKNLKLLNDLQCALNLEEDIRLHTDGLVFMRLYGNAKFWKLIKDDNGVERRQKFNPGDIVGTRFKGDVLFRLDNIFMGVAKRDLSQKSVISVVEEALYKEEESYFNDIPVEK